MSPNVRLSSLVEWPSGARSPQSERPSHGGEDRWIVNSMKAGEEARSSDIQLGSVRFRLRKLLPVPRNRDACRNVRNCRFNAANRIEERERKPAPTRGRGGLVVVFRAVPSRPRSARLHQATVRCRRDRTPAAPIARAARPPRPGTALLPAAWFCPAMMPWPATSL